jgi:two-component system, NtrC family, nitrogen regulation response regulator NtrX
VPQKANLLIVDDDANTLASLSRAFRLAGHEATVCDNAAKALELAEAQAFDLILSDVVMPGKDGLALLEELKKREVAAPVVMMSGQAHIEMAVKATRLGALDFLEKPISTEKLLLTVENALKLRNLESENRQLKQRLGKHEIVWSGEKMRRVMAQVERVAASETRVCILGETGTGKELVARTMHERSPRASGPFVTLPFPPSSSNPNFSATRKVRSPGLVRATWASLSKHNAAPSFSTRSATCLWPCRPNCCACWKKRKSSASAATGRLRLMCG